MKLFCTTLIEQRRSLIESAAVTELVGIIKRDGKARMTEALRTVETGISHLSRLRQNEEWWGLRGYQEAGGKGGRG